MCLAKSSYAVEGYRSMGSLAHTNGYIMLVIVFFASALTVAVVRHYKRNVHSILDSLLLVAVALYRFFLILLCV